MPLNLQPKPAAEWRAGPLGPLPTSSRGVGGRAGHGQVPIGTPVGHRVLSAGRCGHAAGRRDAGTAHHRSAPRRQFRPFHWRGHPAVRGQAQHHIGQREAIAADIGARALQRGLQHRHVAVPGLHAGFDGCGVGVVRAAPHPRHEGIAPGVVQLGGLPVHPLFHPRACRGFGRQQVVPALSRRQITADGVRLK